MQRPRDERPQVRGRVRSGRGRCERGRHGRCARGTGRPRASVPLAVLMKSRAAASLYALLLVLLAVAWARSAWTMPRRNYPFDFSINYTGARLLRQEGRQAPLYNRDRLAAEAAPYTFYPPMYRKLFLTYIQTPLTAVLLRPLAGLSLARARDVWLVISDLLFVAGAAITVYALRPTRLLILAAFLIFATDEVMFDSLRLGQVDGVIVFCLALAFLALRRGKPWLVGAPLAGAALLKLSPALVVGYFLWPREWRVVAGALVAAGALLVLTLSVAGWENHRVFLTDLAPKLGRGSTYYDNVSLTGALERAHFGSGSWFLEDEVPVWPLTLRLAAALTALAVVLGAYLIGRRDAELGFMLATVAAVLVSPVAWSTYLTWLIPSMLFLVHRLEARRDWRRLALLGVLYPLLAIAPFHLRDLGDGIYRYPIKTLALLLYGVLLAWEARSTAARSFDGSGRAPLAVIGSAP